MAKSREVLKKHRTMEFIAFLIIISAIIVFGVPTLTASLVSADDDPFIGNPNAPVTMIMFSQYGCQFSRSFWQNTFPLLKQNYIDTGKVKFVYRDLPPADPPQLTLPSIAAECADEQGAFWQYNQKLISTVNIDKESLKTYAAELGLNIAQFNQCLDSQKSLAEVSKDVQDALSYGVTGTPTFFINGQKVEGDEGFNYFSNLIEKELAK